VKIYTKTGDRGEVPKDHIRVSAYGEVDELNSTIGAAMACEPVAFEAALLESIQRDLFAIGGRLASPEPEKVAKALKKAVIPDQRVGALESTIDRADLEIKPLTSFVLPGGSPKAAAFHLARTVCRRAERAVVALDHTEPVPPIILTYLNRLSDLLFTLARVANHRANVPDRTW
jgi:cob(I)alamin adenosyltransferase